MLSEEDNLALLSQRISELSLRGNTLLLFDFDELVVPIHLTREVTQKVSKPVDRNALDRLGSCSFQGIRYLNSLAYGYDFEEYKKIREEIAKQTAWTNGFDRILRSLQEEYSVVFLSSGIKDICQEKLNEIGFDSRNILGGEFKIEGGQIIDSNLIISDELKGFVIKALKKDFKIIAVGHSLGDKIMLDNADVSISVNSEIPNLAKYNVKFAEDVLKIIRNEPPIH
ncbi:MAG: hypothetical protein Q8Q31_02225 [Nanoarchaeota archaeon]|nr:hypothetical protein [Nanoarchaeota archaeon]